MKDRFPIYVNSLWKINKYIYFFFFLDNQFQESLSFSLLQQNISEVTLEESQSQCLITAGQQLKQHLNSSYGFSDLDEYSSHILPPRKTLEIDQYNTVSLKGIQSTYFSYLT